MQLVISPYLYIPLGSCSPVKAMCFQPATLGPHNLDMGPMVFFQLAAVENGCLNVCIVYINVHQCLGNSVMSVGVEPMCDITLKT